MGVKNFNAFGNLVDRPSHIYESFIGTINNSSTYGFQYSYPEPGNLDIFVQTDNWQQALGSPFPVKALGKQSLVIICIYVFLTCCSELPETLSCHIWGDPHLSTFNNRQFSLQGHGEYLFASLLELTVQIRLSPCTSSATCVSAVHINVFFFLYYLPNNVYQVAANYTGTVVGAYIVNGKPHINVDGDDIILPYTHEASLLTITAPHPWEIQVYFPLHEHTLVLKSYGAWFDVSLQWPSLKFAEINYPNSGGICNSPNGTSDLRTGASYLEYHQYGQQCTLYYILLLFYFTKNNSLHRFNSKERLIIRLRRHKLRF